MSTSTATDVLTDLINTIAGSSENYTVVEGAIEQVVEEIRTDNVNCFIAVMESDADYDLDGRDGQYGAEVEYLISLQIYTRKPTVSDSWRDARTIRDNVLTILKSYTFGENQIPVLANGWERLIFEDDELGAGYDITAQYTTII